MPVRRVSIVRAALVACLLSAGYAQAAGDARCALRIDSGWIRLPPPGATTVAAYARLVNTAAKPLEIVGIDTAIANMSHLHETQLEGSVARMRALGRLTLPAGGSVTLSPSGRHIMMLGVTQRLKLNERISVSFIDASGCTTVGEFPVLVRAPK